MKIYLHAFEPSSRANGPGLRAVLWTQGCSLGCPGCFNSETHDPGAGREVDVELLAGEIAGRHGIDGVSISGGEPLQQAEALCELLERLRPTSLSILVRSEER